MAPRAHRIRGRAPRKLRRLSAAAWVALRRRPATAARTSAWSGMREKKRTWAVGCAAPTGTAVGAAHTCRSSDGAELAADRATALRLGEWRCANDLCGGARGGDAAGAAQLPLPHLHPRARKCTRVSHCGPRGGETLKGEPQGCARRRSPHGGAVRMAGADAATGALVQGVRGISCAGRAAPASVPASLAAHTPSLHTAVAATATAATVPGVAIATIVTAEMIATAAAATSRAPARTRTPCCSRVSTWASRAWVQMGLRASAHLYFEREDVECSCPCPPRCGDDRG